MIKIKYDPYGDKVSDFEAEEYISNKLKEGNDFSFSNEICLLFIRLAVVTGQVSKDSFEIHFDGYVTKCDKFGQLKIYPESIWEKTLERILWEKM